MQSSPLVPQTNHWSLLEMTRLRMEAGIEIECKSSPLATDHWRMRLSAEPENTHRPSFDNAKLITAAVCAASVRVHSPLEIDHWRMVLSSEAENSTDESVIVMLQIGPM